MKYLIVLCVLFAGCSKAEPASIKTEVTSGPFNVGECIHMGSNIYKVTVVGADAYALYQLNTKPDIKDNFYTNPKVDTHKFAVKVDCWDDLRKRHLEYLKTIGQ